jgi:tetratricopeptide (TPR) repeat protein
MSSYPLICTRCHANLCSGSPIPPGEMVRCPQCGSHFTAGEDEETFVPVRRAVSPAERTVLLAFGLLGLFVMLVTGTLGLLLLSKSESSRPSVAESKRQVDDEHAALQRRLDELKDEDARQRRRLEERIRELEAQAKAQNERPPTPAPAPAVNPPRPPEPKVAADDAEKKTRADYEAHLDAGRAAMVDQRYADALREYRVALRLLPGDAAALRGERDAQDRLAALQGRAKQRAAFSDLIDKAKRALRSKRYDEALAAANEALQLVPGDTEAKQIQTEAKQARRAVKTDVSQLVSQADALLAAGRYEEASQLYSQALQLSPTDDAALRGKNLADQTVQNTQNALSAYFRFMATGMLSMQNGFYGDAARAFAESLRLVPGDIAAARGLSDARAALAGVVTGQVNYYRQLQAGYAALQAQRPADAINAFQSALRLVPGSPLATAGLRQANSMNK